MRVWATRSEMIDGRLPFVVTITLIILAAAFGAEAQQPKKAARIGYLSSSSASATSSRLNAFRQKMRELGYVDEKNIVIEYRFAEGNSDRLAELAAELVRLNVAVIVSTGPPSTRAAKKATAVIPIVMAQDPDPVDSGYVISLASTRR